jgi:hypothetical protein
MNRIRIVETEDEPWCESCLEIYCADKWRFFATGSNDECQSMQQMLSDLINEVRQDRIDSDIND